MILIKNISSKKAKSILISNFANKFYKYGIYKTYENCIDYKKEHSHRMLRTMKLKKAPTHELIGQNIILYIQLLLRRSFILLRGCVESIENDNALSAMLNIRAHYEVTGAIGYLASYIEKYYSKSINDDEIIKILSRLNLGRKMEDLKEPFESVNVLSMIDKADRLFMKKSGEEKNILRDSYEWLSEFCHPNSYGLIGEGNFEKDGILEFEVPKKKILNIFSNIIYIDISMPIFFLFFDYIIEMLQKNV